MRPWRVSDTYKGANHEEGTYYSSYGPGCILGFRRRTTEQKAKTGGFTIALLDASNQNTWRIQMENQIQKIVDGYKAKGIVAKYTAYSANNDVNVQTQQLAQLVNEGVNAVIINAVSPTALNPTIDKAVQRGVVVIAVDSIINHPNVVSVINDQTNYAKLHAEWFVNELGGKGNIVVFNAIPGAPANDERVVEYKRILSRYPEIKVLATENHNWNAAEAKQKMSQLLAAYPKIDGVLTQECSAGIIQAFVEAGRPFPKAVTGGEAIEDLRIWDKLKFSSQMVENPPAVGAHGLMVAVRLLQGKKLDPAMLFQPNVIKFKQNLIVTNETRARLVEETKDLKDTDSIDSLMTEEQIDEYFLK